MIFFTEVNKKFKCVLGDLLRFRDEFLKFLMKQTNTSLTESGMLTETGCKNQLKRQLQLQNTNQVLQKRLDVLNDKLFSDLREVV